MPVPRRQWMIVDSYLDIKFFTQGFYQVEVFVPGLRGNDPDSHVLGKLKQLPPIRFIIRRSHPKSYRGDSPGFQEILELLPFLSAHFEIGITLYPSSDFLTPVQFDVFESEFIEFVQGLIQVEFPEGISLRTDLPTQLLRTGKVLRLQHGRCRSHQNKKYEPRDKVFHRIPSLY